MLHIEFLLKLTVISLPRDEVSSLRTRYHFEGRCCMTGDKKNLCKQTIALSFTQALKGI